MASTASQRALDYLEKQPGMTLAKLYQQPSTAFAIFRRMLPHLAKTIVMTMLYMRTPFAVAELESMFKHDAEIHTQLRDRALSILQRLHILREVHEPGRRAAYELSKSFARSLRCALTGGGTHRSFGVPCSSTRDDKPPVTVDYLDVFARKQWEAILYYVVGSANAGLQGEVDISAGTKRLLQYGGQHGAFVTVRGRHAYITQAGFTFLLQEINAQVWTLLIVYLEFLDSSTTLQMDPVDVLSFLFTLGSHELGVCYSTSNLTPTQQAMLDDLSDFGLVYRRSRESTRYYPTRLATTLNSDASALPNSSLMSTTVSGDASGGGADEKGYIIVETNFRLYACTDSPLLISILSLFARLDTRYPGFITAKITKKSVQNAITAGITADQIITYLTTHAHPVLRRQQAVDQPILPPTVVDQIRLWQLEGERMAQFRGFLIRDLGSTEEYDKAVQYAGMLGVLKEEFRHKGWFFVSRMDQMKGYFTNRAKEKREAREAAQRAASGS